MGCCTKDIPVPWNESLAVMALGLWSILSTAAVVNRQLVPCESVEMAALQGSGWAQALVQADIGTAEESTPNYSCCLIHTDLRAQYKGHRTRLGRNCLRKGPLYRGFHQHVLLWNSMSRGLSFRVVMFGVKHLSNTTLPLSLNRCYSPQNLNGQTSRAIWKRKWKWNGNENLKRKYKSGWSLNRFVCCCWLVICMHPEHSQPPVLPSLVQCGNK